MASRKKKTVRTLTSLTDHRTGVTISLKKKGRKR